MIRRLTNVPHYTWGRMCDGWHLLDGADLSVIQERVPHLFFVLAGQLNIQIDRLTHTLAAGDAIEVPPGRPHRVRNSAAAGADASFLVISAPSTRGDRQDLGD